MYYYHDAVIIYFVNLLDTIYGLNIIIGAIVDCEYYSIYYQWCKNYEVVCTPILVGGACAGVI